MRAFDLAASIIALGVLAPLFAVVSFVIRMGSSGPAYFRQNRLGRDGREFSTYKFRTMTQGTEQAGPGMLTAVHDTRITRVGRFLRDWSLDELPPLFNVLRGEMSMVGPRPAIAAYRDRFDARQDRRHDVPPGLTGWAQVNGRNRLSWGQKIERDLWYVEHRSLGLNLRITARTIPILATREGLYGPPENFTMLTSKRGVV